MQMKMPHKGAMHICLINERKRNMKTTEKKKNPKTGLKERIYLLAQLLVIGVLFFILTYQDVLYSLDNLYKDHFYQIPRAMDNQIKIIAIDEKTLQDLGPFGTWSRSTYADILSILSDYPAVVGFDIMMMGQMDEAGDAAFLETAKAYDNVVLASYIDYETKVGVDEAGKSYIDYFHIQQIEIPYTKDAVKTGFANTSADTDGIIRSYVPIVSYENEEGETKTLSSFALKVYQTYCEQMNLPGIPPRVDKNGAQWIYYAGKPGDYETISLTDLLSGKVDPRIFTNCIVLVGAYANGLQDQYAVPNSAGQMFGVEINANLVQSYLDEQQPLPANRLLTALCTAVLAMGLYFIFRKMKLKWGTVVFALAEVFLVVSGILFYTKLSIILPAVYLMIAFALDYVVALGFNYLAEYLHRRKMSKAFRKYVAPQVVDEIMKNGSYNVKLGGENRDIAVLFVDIRGFTPLSESLKPEQVVEILNEYLNLTTNAIFKNSGTLDKFIGDATMAVFNAPFALEDYEYKAVCAAWDIVAGAKALEQSCMERFGKSVAFGVGVNCGEAVVGNIGCDFRMDYTAIGDTVNTAARLEANAGRGKVYISEELRNRLGDRITVEEVGEIPLKGKSKGIFVYSLTGIEGKE